METNPSLFKGEKRPVECVSWEDAQAFCEKLSARSGKQIRLPTEAEWEYGCRAGTTTAFFFGSMISTEQANYNGGSDVSGISTKGKYRAETTDVGTFPSNKLGLYDMHGNVYQWCEDFYGEYPKKAVIDPKGLAQGVRRVLRGGSWNDGPDNCRSASRYSHGATDGRSALGGFRVVVAP